MAEQNNQVTSWPSLAEGLYSFLTGRGTTIEYEFDNMEVFVPGGPGAEPIQAHWRLNGTLRIRTDERAGAAGP